MTCVVGLVEGARVWIGGDSAMSTMHELVASANPKVCRVGDFLIGAAGSLRAADTLRYAFDPPKHARRMDVGRYMRTAFIDAVRDALKKGGVLQQQHGIDQCDAHFLIGYRGRLFVIEDDLHIHETTDSYAAIGDGGPVASGALAVSAGVAPRKRILAALTASERYTPSVRRPFYVQALDP